MKKYIAACVLFAGCSFQSFAQQPASINHNTKYSPVTSANISAAAATAAVCSVSQVPAGWVIFLQTANNPACGLYNPSYLIKPAQSGDVICGFSPIPQGFVVIARGVIPSCSNSPYSAPRIVIPGNVQTVCSDSPIPSNYRIVGYAFGGQCGVPVYGGALVIARN